MKKLITFVLLSIFTFPVHAMDVKLTIANPNPADLTPQKADPVPIEILWEEKRTCLQEMAKNLIINLGIQGNESDAKKIFSGFDPESKTRIIRMGKNGDPSTVQFQSNKDSQTGNYYLSFAAKYFRRQLHDKYDNRYIFVQCSSGNSKGKTVTVKTGSTVNPNEAFTLESPEFSYSFYHDLSIDTD